jgi:hypothetical protein
VAVVGFWILVFASFNAKQSKIDSKNVQMFVVLRLIKLQKTHNAGFLATKSYFCALALKLSCIKERKYA